MRNYSKIVNIVFGILCCSIIIFLVLQSNTNHNFIPPRVKDFQMGKVPDTIRCALNTHTPLHRHVQKTAHEVEETIESMLLQSDETFEDYARRLTALVNRNMTQWFLHQHELKSFDDVVHVTTSFRDNYVYWLFTAVRYLFGIRRPLELVEPEDILFRGYGFCSQHALLIAKILEQQGIKTKIHGLNGHVVPEMIAPDGQSFILDTNANLVLPGTVSTLAKNPEFLEKAYFKAWHDYYVAFSGVSKNDTHYDAIRRIAMEDAKAYATLYTTQDDNKVFSGTDDYVNYWEIRFWRFSKVAKYLLPVLLGIIALYFLGKSRRKSK